MNQHLQNILNIVQQDERLTAEQKDTIAKSLKDADKELEITAFKLDRTEKVKRTTAILLEETIEELEQKRKAVEAQARQAQVEAALERVRSRTMAMHKTNELLDAAELVYKELSILGINSMNISYAFVDEEEKYGSYYSVNPVDGRIPPFPFVFPHTETKVMLSLLSSWKKQEPFNVIELDEKATLKHQTYIGEHILQLIIKNKIDIPFSVGSFLAISPKTAVIYSFNFKQGYLFVIGEERLTTVQEQMLLRFTKVFEQTYTRFLDLQKAEAQAREAQIEAALERVRSRSLAMHKSDELREVIQVIYEQFVQLNIRIDGAGFAMDYMESDDFNFWLADPNTAFPYKVHIPYFNHPQFNRYKEAKEKGLDFYTSSLTPEERNRFFDHISIYIPIPKEFMEVVYSAPGYETSHVVLKNVILYILNFSGLPFSDADNNTLMRFGKVFEQTYTRFNDLQKAEAQAREAKIEAALERTRTQSMIMQHSKELDDTLRVFHEQVLLLGIHSAFSFLWLPDEEKDRHIFWAAWGEDLNNSTVYKSKAINYPLDRNEPATAQCLVDWKGNEPIVSYHVPPAGVENYFAAWQELIDGVEQLKPEYFSGGLYYAEAFMKYGCFGVMVVNDLTEDEKKILGRFAIEFERTYTRFLDLQKAEAQAREAQIEAALERVRAKTMAMYKSEQLAETAKVLFEQFSFLGKIPDRMSIGIIREERKIFELWVTDQSGNQEDHVFDLSINEPTSIAKFYKAWKERKDAIIVDLTGQNFQDWMHYIKDEVGLIVDETQIKGRRVQQAAFFSQGFLLFTTHEPVADEIMQLLVRFARVFDLTYTRFLDLQKAEAQTREAIIEAALERVRGKAMAMHNSHELTATASMVFTELHKLGINSIRSGVGLLNKENRKVILYSVTSTEEGDQLSLEGRAMLQDHPVLSEIYDSWIRQEDYFPVLKGELLKGYYEKIVSGFAVPGSHYKNDQLNNALTDTNTGYEQHGHFLPFSEGFLYGWSEKRYTETEIKVLNRFKTIIDLTFRRYIELKKSEVNAREAIKQAALDRIRADIASMRTIGDLDRITPLIWNELTILGIPIIRCGVFIMDETQQLIHTFLSTPDGKAIAAFHLPYDTSGNLSKVLSHWKDNKKYIDHWDQTAFLEMAGILVKQGAIASPEQYLDSIPPGGFYLHFLPFLQGMLYAGNTIQLGDDEIKLLQSVADAFSTAYARYEDFNKLEAAKEQVDKTLVDLRQAQQQLVQSEKMASLGELTAGIAHEIQNPLNFVNNFSEVSSELLDEMKEEIEKGNYEEAKAITDDVKENLEKILHHGKRADGIVKGMLQHSRSSSGVKEPTDINALADEYLRLAYHGLRAKDPRDAAYKSFNVIMKTDFDETIGKVNIIPQDIGRVVLNLITNAFYVVNEKSKQNIAGYEPTVAVSTKKDGNKVLVSVKDNGNGIPQKILDKIFQPFFTTKPTGQGTGLGLSLSYDIVKAHGGEIRVETLPAGEAGKEGNGTEFIIQLPI